MIPERTALTLQPNTEPCKQCGCSIPVAKIENGEVYVDAYLEPFCSQECIDRHEEDENERAYERYLQRRIS